MIRKKSKRKPKLSINFVQKALKNEISIQTIRNEKTHLAAREYLLSGETASGDKLKGEFQENVEAFANVKTAALRAKLYEEFGVPTEQSRVKPPQPRAIADLPRTPKPSVQASPPPNNPETPKAEAVVMQIIITPPEPSRNKEAAQGDVRAQEAGKPKLAAKKKEVPVELYLEKRQNTDRKEMELLRNHPHYYLNILREKLNDPKLPLQERSKVLQEKSHYLKLYKLSMEERKKAIESEQPPQSLAGVSSDLARRRNERINSFLAYRQQRMDKAEANLKLYNEVQELHNQELETFNALKHQAEQREPREGGGFKRGLAGG